MSTTEQTPGLEELEAETEVMTINMGPHHPATHGVLRLVVQLEGEVVLDLKPVVGYLHTGIEKPCEMQSRIDQYEALLDRNEIFLRRTRGVGIVPKQRLLDLGVTGPLLRAAGEPWDLRKVTRYLAYPELEFKVPVGTVGDGYDRYRV